MIKNILPADGEEISVRGYGAKLFFDAYERYKDTPHFGHPAWTYWPDERHLSYPCPCTLTVMTDFDTYKKELTFHLARRGDFSKEITRKAVNVPGVVIYNLMIGESYSWYAECGDEKSEITSFTTRDEYPRQIYIGMKSSNIRDVGGVYNIDGKRVKQGLLYRGGCIDAGGDHVSSDEGARMFVEDLGIKSDVDLRFLDYAEREKWPERHPLIEEKVKIYRLADESYGSIDESPDSVHAKMLRILSDEKNLPAYFHCYSGMDRTGSAAFIFGLLLRIDLETLYIDYELSSLDEWGSRARECLSEERTEQLRVFGDEGDDIYTCAEKLFVEKYGMAEELARFRKIFLD